MSRVTFLTEKIKGGAFLEDIDHLCKEKTNLSDSDVLLLHSIAERIKEISKRENRDCFINVPLKDGSGTMTVCACYPKDSMYSYSTIGAIVNENEPAVFRTALYGIESHDTHAKSFTSTEGNDLIQDCYPVMNDNNDIIAVIVTERAMTSEDYASWHKREYKVPNFNKYPYLKNLTYIAECESDSIIVLNSEKRVVYRNDSAVKLYAEFGYIYDIFETYYEDVSLHGKIKVGIGIDNSSSESELSIAGKYLEIKEYCYCYDYPGKEYFYIIVISDVTQSKLKENDIISKSVALREAHHRVKNNLQTVYNLLEMQRRRLDNESARGALADAMNRISSIASAYEVLSKQSDEIVNILSLLQVIVSNFEQLIADYETSVDIKLTGDDTFTSKESATDIALVVNELLQNILKHAFVGRKEGKIRIKVLKRPLHSEILVSDDGVGFDCSLVNCAVEGLGHQLAENIVKSKLKGQINYTSDSSGTTVMFTFKSLN